MEQSNKLNNVSEVDAGKETGGRNEWKSVSDVEFAGDKIEDSVADIAKQGWAKMTGYYKKNPDKIADLVQEYLANDNGAEVPGVNEIAEQGWAKMTGYYKKNPDQISGLTQAYLANMRIAREKAEAEANAEGEPEEPGVADIAKQGWAKMTGYYKKNPDQIANLVQEYLANDNGAEAPGVNDIAKQGWAKMTGYYKENPDQISNLTQAYLANMRIAREKAEAEAEEKAKTPDDKAYEAWSNMTKEELDARSDAYRDDFLGETSEARRRGMKEMYPQLENESDEDYKARIARMKELTKKFRSGENRPENLSHKSSGYARERAKMFEKPVREPAGGAEKNKSAEANAESKEGSLDDIFKDMESMASELFGGDVEATPKMATPEEIEAARKAIEAKEKAEAEARANAEAAAENNGDALDDMFNEMTDMANSLFGGDAAEAKDSEKATPDEVAAARAAIKKRKAEAAAEAEKFGKFGEIRFLLGSDDSEITPDKYLRYSASDTLIEAIPRENLLAFLEDKLNRTETGSEFGEDMRLIQEIRKEYADNKEIIEKLDEIENSVDFKKKRLTAELDSRRHTLKARQYDLERCRQEVEKFYSGGFFKRISNMAERNAAQDRYNWTKRDVDAAQADIARIEAQLAELEDSADTSDSGATAAENPALDVAA